VNETGLPGGLPGVPSELHGRPTRRLENGECWLEVLVDGGPRIVGFGLAGKANVLAELPDVSWDAGLGIFELVGGHRLWMAPESPACSAPDSTGLQVSALAGGLRLTGTVQPPHGIRKTFEVILAPDAAAVHIHHVIANEGAETLELSPWPITVMRLGGTATVEFPPYSTSRAPAKLVVLWPYTSWSDERLSLGDHELVVRARSGDEFKVGCFSHLGRVAYDIDGARFVKSFDPAAGRAHPDMGTNLQIYVNADMIEVESLAPLARLAPGDSVGWDEDWDIGAI
jgi:hypothetical protein